MPRCSPLAGREGSLHWVCVHFSLPSGYVLICPAVLISVSHKPVVLSIFPCAYSPFVHHLWQSVGSNLLLALELGSLVSYHCPGGSVICSGCQPLTRLTTCRPHCPSSPTRLLSLTVSYKEKYLLTAVNYLSIFPFYEMCFWCCT